MRSAPASGYSRCVGTDSAGRYSLDSLPPEPFDFDLQCTPIRGGAHKLAHKYITPKKSSAVTRQDWNVSTEGCDRRPVRQIDDTFRGHYTYGIETSDFVPCRADSWYQPSDSMEQVPPFSRRAWVTWRREPRDMKAWPATERDSFGNPHYYVRWQGRLRGPGHYGAFGGSGFELSVDTVFEVRPARLGDRSP